MTLRILFTLAILAGLAAAPAAEQTFHWEAGRHDGHAFAAHLGEHIERALERVSDVAERMADRVGYRVERLADRISDRAEYAAERAAARAERQADHIRIRVESRVRVAQSEWNGAWVARDGQAIRTRAVSATTRATTAIAGTTTPTVTARCAKSASLPRHWQWTPGRTAGFA